MPCSNVDYNNFYIQYQRWNTKYFFICRKRMQTCEELDRPDLAAMIELVKERPLSITFNLKIV
jgi:hypothetical protein